MRAPLGGSVRLDASGDRNDVHILADLLGTTPATIRRCVKPWGGPEALLRIDPGDALPRRARRRLEALLYVYGLWDRAQERPPALEGPSDVARYMGPRLAGLPWECFWVIAVDARSRPLGTYQVAQGTLTACLVHPREVFHPAIRARAASLVLVHNHPSGDARPSAEDLRLTRRLEDAGELLGIPVLDHVILTPGHHTSVRAAEEDDWPPVARSGTLDP